MHKFLRRYRRSVSGCLRIAFWACLIAAGEPAAAIRLLFGWGFSGTVSVTLAAVFLVYVAGAETQTPLPLDDHVDWLFVALAISWATDDGRFLLDRRRPPDDPAESGPRSGGRR